MRFAAHVSALLQPRTAAAEVIRQFDESKHSVHIRAHQTIFHPGEVLHFPQITHTVNQQSITEIPKQ